MTPNREQIVAYIAAHPGTTTIELTSAFEDPSNEVAFNRAYSCVWKKLVKLSARGEIIRVSQEARRDGMRWDVPRRCS